MFLFNHWYTTIVFIIILNNFITLSVFILGNVLICVFFFTFLLVYISAVKRLTTINRIQNKSFCLHNICVYTVYIYYVYINTHTYRIYLENIYVYTFIYSYFYILYYI